MDDCCRNHPPGPVQKEPERCRSCNQPGKPWLTGRSKRSLSRKPEVRDTVDGRIYGFCDTPTCSTDKLD